MTKSKIKSAKSPKSAKSLPKKPEPTTGQSAPPIELAPDQLNPKELRLLRALAETEVATIAELAATCWPREKERQNSWTRNSLRRPACAGLLERVDDGVYQITRKGLRLLSQINTTTRKAA